MEHGQDHGPKRSKNGRRRGKSAIVIQATRGGFRLLPVKVLDSDAFNELSKSAKLVLIISLSQLDYWQKKKHQRSASAEIAP